MTRQSKLLRWSIFYALIFAVAPPAFAQQWNEQVLYSFQGGTDGSTPVGAVVFDKQGYLYGATSFAASPSCAGVGGCGMVYRLSPAKNGDPWTETILHVFQGLAFGDGGGPEGGLGDGCRRESVWHNGL